MNWDPAMMVPSGLPWWAIIVQWMWKLPTILILFTLFVAMSPACISLASWTWGCDPYFRGPLTVKSVIMSATVIPVTALLLWVGFMIGALIAFIWACDEGFPGRFNRCN